MSAHEALLSLDPAGNPRDAIERFVARVLFDAGVWPSPRTSDGLRSHRVVEHGPARVRVCGEIWQIDQTSRPFWLDVERGAGAASARWTLFFDVDRSSTSTRGARLLVDAIQDPADVAWLVTLTGTE